MIEQITDDIINTLKDNVAKPKVKTVNQRKRILIFTLYI